MGGAAAAVAVERRTEAQEVATQVDNSAELYDALDELWLSLYGQHVHVGFYPDPADKTSVRFADAQDRTVDQIIALAGLSSKTKKLLDVGCGVGGTSCHIAKKLGCKAVGVNISASQVATANRLARQQGLLPSQVLFVEGDALNLPESLGTADAVLAFESACYMPDKRRFIQQLASRVERGGKVLLIDFVRGPDSLSPDQAGYLQAMDRLFATAGDWHSMAEYRAMLEAEGLRVLAVADWSQHIKGFWEAGLWELFTAVPDVNKRGVLGTAPAIIAKLLHTGLKVVTGGWPTLKMAATFLTASQRRIVRGAFNSGALRYQVLVATKP